MQQLPRENGYKLPEYLEMVEVNALIAAAPNPRARLIMLEQSRAGLRVSEALALEARDLHLDSDRPTLVVRQGKGRKARVVPVHPELQTALTAATSFEAVGQGRLIEVSRVTVWRWVQQAVLRATEAGQIPQGRSVGNQYAEAQLCAAYVAQRDSAELLKPVVGPRTDSDHGWFTWSWLRTRRGVWPRCRDPFPWCWMGRRIAGSSGGTPCFATGNLW